MQVTARAKVNWTLDILGVRPDGYHLMDMLMQPITLADTLLLEAADGISLTVEGNPEISALEDNLVWRAATALQKACGCKRGVSIHLTKRTPSGAGLGGGSADAAGTLKGLNTLWGLGLSEEQLEEIGLTLGADVPFCLRGGLARVGGIGEEIASLPEGPVWPLVIVQPCAGLSTGAVFRGYHAAATVARPDTEAACAALLRQDLPGLAAAWGNVLQGVSEKERPEITEAIRALKEHGASLAAMSGSGSAVFGVFADPASAEAACAVLRCRWEKTYLCTSCTESVLLP